MVPAAVRRLLWAAAAMWLGSAAIPVHAVPTLPPAVAERPEDLEAENTLAAILADLAQQRDALIKIHRELVRLPGINPEDGGEGEEAKARWIEDWLAAEGLPPAERVDCPDERVPSKIRPNLILRHPQLPNGRPTLWLIAYLDNSPPGNRGAWLGSPFSLRVDGDRLYGLGVQDNNDGIAAALLLLRSLAKLERAAPLNLGVLLVAGEKKGSRVGFLHLLSERPDLFNATDHFLVLSYGGENGDLVELGEKGVLWLQVKVCGRQAHAAFPDQGSNALAAGAELIARVPRLAERFPERNPLFDPPTNTFVPTKPGIHEPAAPNQIPDYFSFNLDARLLPGSPGEAVEAAVAEMAAAVARDHGVTIDVEPFFSLPTSPVTPPEAPVVRALVRAIDRQLRRPVRFCGVGGVSVAADLRRRGFAAAVWRMAPFQENAANESMAVSANLTEAAVAARLLFDPVLAAAAPAGQR